MSKFLKLLSAAAVSLTIGVTGASAGGSLKHDNFADWSGFYAGFHFGGASGDADWNWQGGTGVVSDRITGGACGTPPGGAAGCSFSQGLDGVLVGAHLTYRRQSGDFVYGAELSFSKTSLDGQSVSGVSAADDIFKTDVNETVAVTAQVGWAGILDWLVYVKGGYAGGNVETAILDSQGINTGNAFSSEWHSGWTVGAGVSYMLGSNMTLGIEYNYTDLGSTGHARSFNGDGGTVDDDLDITYHAVMTRISVKLGN